jgi:hypothetical protein
MNDEFEVGLACNDEKSGVERLTLRFAATM